MLWKDKVCISKQMYAYFFPAAYIFRLFGIFPFTIERTSLGLFFKWSPWYTLYGYILALLLIVTSVTEAVSGMFSKGEIKLDIINNTDNFVWLFTVTIYCLATFVATFITPRKFGQLCDYIKCINQVESIKTNLAKSSKRRVDFAGIVLLMDSAVVTISICCTYFLNNVNIFDAMHSVFFRVAPFALHILIGDMIQYMIRLMTYILSMRFVHLNEVLEYYYKKIKNGENVVSRPHLNTIMVLQRDNEITIKAENIMVMSKAYLKLKEAANILDNYFGLMILLVMASSVSQLISTPYHLILSLQGKRRGFSETLRRLLKFSEQLLRVLVLIEPIYECMTKMKATERQVCNLLSVKTERRFRKQIHAFAMSICLNELKFTACGFFNIDRFLISTLVGTVTTYVVILLQVQEQEA